MGIDERDYMKDRPSGSRHRFQRRSGGWPAGPGPDDWLRGFLGAYGRLILWVCAGLLGALLIALMASAHFRL